MRRRDMGGEPPAGMGIRPIAALSVVPSRLPIKTYDVAEPRVKYGTGHPRHVERRQRAAERDTTKALK